ncbi:protein fem-1 homolog C-like [Corticium candelabrum]|uniref:protein fem-1 homolog C-like n=1 Tax=Corticium candelabrum TaxID=121492 RepID=UPI002E2646F8|nr:protein fem-1 homolog C-like [Corticium candelabrum]XP_062523168.1 protein fem-1 homolog C-like [Corticium candelabrum]
MSADVLDDLLLTAIDDDDVESLERTFTYLSHQNPPPARHFDDPYLLLAAVTKRKALVTRYLIETRRVPIDCTGRISVNRGETQCGSPLFAACALGFLELVGYLVEQGADVRQRNEFGESPLHIACKCGHVDIVKFLSGVGASLEEYSSLGRTPLLTAAAEGHVEVIRELVKAGADLNTRTVESGGSCLHACSFVSGSVPAARLLLDLGLTPQPNRFGILPILDAAAMGNDEMLTFWMKYYEPSLSKNAVLACNALSLAGTNFWRRNKAKAFMYFYRSLKLRIEQNLPEDEFAPLPPVSDYLNGTEVTTLSELQMLQESNDILRLQQHCFMVRERILGSCHVTIARPCITYGYYLARSGYEKQVLPMWLYVLDRQIDRFLRDRHPTLAYATLFTLAQSLRLTELEVVNPLPAFERLLLILKNIGKSHERTWVMCELGLHFLSLVLMHANKFPGSINHHDVVQLTYHFLEIAPTGPRGQTLLHCAVNSQTTTLHTDSCLGLDLCTFPCIDTISCLLAAGACVNAVDVDRNMPLHVLLASCSASVDPKIVRLLLKAGAYPYARNESRARPSFYCNNRPEVLEVLQQAESISLQMLASYAIVDHNVRYKDVLPQKLVQYVGMH